MPITIAQRLRPFSHRPGIAMLLPHTSHILRLFPTRIEPVGHSPIELPIQGPVTGFTALQDLEKGSIKVWGFSAEGYFRYRLSAAAQRVTLHVEKSAPPLKDQSFTLKNLQIGSSSQEQISFGVDREQEWEQVVRRFDLAEMLPFFLD